MSFADVGNHRGFHVHNKSNGFIQFVSLELPQHVSMTHKQTIIPSNITGNTVRLVFTEDIGTVESSKIVDEVRSLNPQQLFIKMQIDTGFTDEKMDTDTELVIKSNKDIHIDYIEKDTNIPENLHKGTLIKMLDGLWGKI